MLAVDPRRGTVLADRPEDGTWNEWLTNLHGELLWGGKFVQPWPTFPAEKWDTVPLSDASHASMNHTAREEVPWTLELAPLPASGSQAGVQLLPEGTPVVFETVVAAARALGFDARVQVSAPEGDTGVWTLSRDSMSYDSTEPTAGRSGRPGIASRPASRPRLWSAQRHQGRGQTWHAPSSSRNTADPRS